MEDGIDNSTEVNIPNLLVNGDIPFRPEPEEALRQQLEEFRNPKPKKQLPPGAELLRDGRTVTDLEAAQAATALGLGAEWVRRSKHLIMLAKYTAQFPSCDNMIGHAQIDIGTLERVIAQCEMIQVDEKIPAAEKLKWCQTIVAAVKTKSNMMLMIHKAKALQEGIREDLQRDEKRKTYAPPSMGQIQIKVEDGGTVEVHEKAS